MKVRAGLIQMSLKGDTSMSPEQIREAMIEAHLPVSYTHLTLPTSDLV